MMISTAFCFCTLYSQCQRSEPGDLQQQPEYVATGKKAKVATRDMAAYCIQQDNTNESAKPPLLWHDYFGRFLKSSGTCTSHHFRKQMVEL